MNEKYDVIVVGNGNAALSAHENGAKVLMLEAASDFARVAGRGAATAKASA